MTVLLAAVGAVASVIGLSVFVKMIYIEGKFIIFYTNYINKINSGEKLFAEESIIILDSYIIETLRKHLF